MLVQAEGGIGQQQRERKNNVVCPFFKELMTILDNNLWNMSLAKENPWQS